MTSEDDYTMKYDHELIGGPQDGGYVTRGVPMPKTIYVGPKWLGDGYVAWGEELCERFPVRYVANSNGRHFEFQEP